MAQRNLSVSKDALVVQSGPWGAGADDHLPIGDHGSVGLIRSLIQFNLNFDDVTSINFARLYLRANNYHAAIGSTAGINVRRITSSWSEGTHGADEIWYAANAVTWSNQPSTTATNEVTDASFGRTDEAWEFVDITAIVNDWFTGSTNRGVRIAASNEGDANDHTGFYSRESAYDPYILLDYETNVPPDPPTLTSPANAAVVNDQTPDLSFTHNDDDGDPISHYEVEVDNNSDFSSPTWDSGKTVTADGTPTVTVGTTLTRGTTYHWRARTWSDNGEVSGWSTTRTFTVASLPVATLSSPSAADVAAPLYYTAGSDTTPKFRIDWTFSCPEGGSQSSARVYVYDSAGTGLLHTHNHSGTATIADLSAYAPTNGTKYQISVDVTCSHGAVSTETAKRRVQVRWGRASYRADLGSAPLTLSVDTATQPNSGSVVMEYATSAATTPEPTDWKADIAEATKQRYVWHRVTLLPQSVASPTSPKLFSVTFDYSANALVPDDWVLPGTFSMDTSTYVYGTQSLKGVVSAAQQQATQEVPVVPNTDYILSGRIKTQGDPNARIRLVASGSSLVADVIATADTDWARYVTPVWNSGGATSVEVHCMIGSSGLGYNGSAWFDALKLEASKVVTPWTPGFLGDAVVLDAGGVNVDASKGGVFRLRSGSGAVLELDTDTGSGSGLILTDGVLRVARSSSANHILQGYNASGSIIEFAIQRDGRLSWRNPSTGSEDTILLRRSAGVIGPGDTDSFRLWDIGQVQFGATNDAQIGWDDANSRLQFIGNMHMEDSFSVDGNITADADGESIRLSQNGYIELTERSAGTPSVPAATNARLYLDNSGGISRLRIRFDDGTTVTLAASAA